MNAPRESWSEEQIHAFVDGELDATTAARIAAELQHDAVLASRVARQRELRELLTRKFNPVLHEPVPDQLLAAMDARQGKVTPIGGARRASARLVAPRPLWWTAAAASVLVAALLGWQLPRGSGAMLEAGGDGLMAAGALEKALSGRVAEDGPRESGVGILLSFRDSDGRYCRAFRLDSGVDGLACRGTEGWQIEATGRMDASRQGDEYRQASSVLSAAVLTAISSRQTGEVLTPAEERRVRDQDWRGASE